MDNQASSSGSSKARQIRSRSRSPCKEGRELRYDGRCAVGPLDAAKRTGRSVFFNRVDNFQFPVIKETDPEKMTSTHSKGTVPKNPNFRVAPHLEAATA
jgi:hypothetical protein